MPVHHSDDFLFRISVSALSKLENTYYLRTSAILDIALGVSRGARAQTARAWHNSLNYYNSISIRTSWRVAGSCAYAHSDSALATVTAPPMPQRRRVSAIRRWKSWRAFAYTRAHLFMQSLRGRLLVDVFMAIGRACARAMYVSHCAHTHSDTHRHTCVARTAHARTFLIRIVVVACAPSQPVRQSARPSRCGRLNCVYKQFACRQVGLHLRCTKVSSTAVK